MRPTDQLFELIRKKHQVLSQLREVGLRQLELVEGGDVSTLLTLLGAKQQLITGLQTLEQELAPFYSEEPDRRIWHSAEHRAECARKADQCNMILKEVVALEKRVAERMSARRNEVAEQLQQAHNANHVRGAYEISRRRAS